MNEPTLELRIKDVTLAVLLQAEHRLERRLQAKDDQQWKDFQEMRNTIMHEVQEMMNNQEEITIDPRPVTQPPAVLGAGYPGSGRAAASGSATVPGGVQQPGIFPTAQGAQGSGGPTVLGAVHSCPGRVSATEAATVPVATASRSGPFGVATIPGGVQQPGTASAATPMANPVPLSSSFLPSPEIPQVPPAVFATDRRLR